MSRLPGDYCPECGCEVEFLPIDHGMDHVYRCIVCGFLTRRPVQVQTLPTTDTPYVHYRTAGDSGPILYP